MTSISTESLDCAQQHGTHQNRSHSLARSNHCFLRANHTVPVPAAPSRHADAINTCTQSGSVRGGAGQDWGHAGAAIRLRGCDRRAGFSNRSTLICMLMQYHLEHDCTGDSGRLPRCRRHPRPRQRRFALACRLMNVIVDLVFKITMHDRRAAVGSVSRGKGAQARHQRSTH